MKTVAAITISAWLVACGASKPATTSTSGGGGSATTAPTGGGQLCGTRGASPCPADQFCSFEIAAECGATDKGGTCTAKPAACPRIAEPVCGCDGKTYGNGCEASAAGVSVKHTGGC